MHQDALAKWLEFFSFGAVRGDICLISPFPDYGFSTKLIPSDLPSWDHFDWSWLWLCVTPQFSWPLSLDTRVSAPSSPSVTKDSPFCKEQLPSAKVECISAQLFIASLGGRDHISPAWICSLAMRPALASDGWVEVTYVTTRKKTACGLSYLLSWCQAVFQVVCFAAGPGVQARWKRWWEIRVDKKEITIVVSPGSLEKSLLIGDWRSLMEALTSCWVAWELLSQVGLSPKFWRDVTGAPVNWLGLLL